MRRLRRDAPLQLRQVAETAKLNQLRPVLKRSDKNVDDHLATQYDEVGVNNCTTERTLQLRGLFR